MQCEHSRSHPLLAVPAVKERSIACSVSSQGEVDCMQCEQSRSGSLHAVPAV